MKAPDRLPIFAYVDVEKSPLYRAVMQLFVEEKQNFGIHLRPSEVCAALKALGLDARVEETEAALEQLAEWGNLRGDPDTADVTTVEDFYKKRMLYQLTEAGEAAERAIAFFEEQLGAPGELQATALSDIRDLLCELRVLADADVPDPGKIYSAFVLLRVRFEELTGRAQVFMGSLQKAIDLHTAEESVFLAYKERLIDYLESFIRDLLVAVAANGGAIRDIEAKGVERLLAVVARRETADRVEVDEPVVEEATRRWFDRWKGLRNWFIGAGGLPSQADILRARARAAIPALLSAVAALHDRRLTRTDRHADLRTLARWFAQTDSAEEAHRLWHVGFGLSPARHLRVNDETLDSWQELSLSPNTPWSKAPRLKVAPRMRSFGAYSRKGQPRKVVDRSSQKAELAEMAREQIRQIARAKSVLATGRRTKLSDLDALDPASFELFLDILAEALSQKKNERDAVLTTSADGSMSIVLEPIPGAGRAVIETSAGRLTGPDHWITVTDAHAAAPPRREKVAV